MTPRRVVCVTLNPSIDRTLCRVDADEAGWRVRLEHETAGGKGNNVARILRVLNVPTLAIVCAGGQGAKQITELLARDDVPVHLVPAPHNVRFHTTILRKRGRPLFVHEAGSPWWDDLYPDISRALATVYRAGDVVVVGGSPPPASPVTLVRDLIRYLGTTPTIVDAGPQYLIPALGANPYLVKVNDDELRRAWNMPEAPIAELLEKTAPSCIVGAVATMGKDGARAIWEEAFIQVQPLRVNEIASTLGAGDAFMAGLLWGLYRGETGAACLARASAVAAESIRWPTAGSIDPGRVNLDAIGVSVENRGGDRPW